MTAWEQVLDDLVRARGRALVRYATLLTGDEREGEDLVQDALVRCFSQGRPLREAAAAEAYVRRAVLTIFLDGHRRRTRWTAVRHLVARDDSSADHGPSSSTRLDVQTALLVLRPRLRACVVLRFYDDLTVPEIARRLEVSDGTVKRYLFDAIGQLEALLGPLPDAHTLDIQLIPTGATR
ncbi:sigma-70 family RNA polymerase sigma factor [uncultured Cellulomonas sp.]|uniref:RNA polymerase sigma factor n=1 Tax=uncultured Cellulomonas sp. TaxID=189682 RepID=UPI0028EA7157|nr:sigma-70 family RNA polymerase sigma factor [uncultured Cellulomonas sp.]